MTNHPKDAHIPDSASSGKGESMATEGRAEMWLNERAIPLEWPYYTNKQYHTLKLAEALALFAESECSRISDIPAQSSEARPGIGNAVESNAADEKGLASRVEELEAEVRREWWLNHGTGCIPYGDDGEMQCHHIDFKRTPLDELRMKVFTLRQQRVNLALAQPSGNTPGQKS